MLDSSDGEVRALADKVTHEHNSLERELYRSLARVRTLMPADAGGAATALVEAEREAIDYFLHPSRTEGSVKNAQSAVLRAVEAREAFETVSAQVIQVAGRT